MFWLANSDLFLELALLQKTKAVYVPSICPVIASGKDREADHEKNHAEEQFSIP